MNSTLTTDVSISLLPLSLTKLSKVLGLSACGTHRQVKLIYQVYEVDPSKCPKCGAQMKIIAFIVARKEIVRILKHLDMWSIAYPKPVTIDARASPLDFKLLRKLSVSSHLN